MKEIFLLRLKEQKGAILAIIISHLVVSAMIVWSYEAFTQETGFMVQMFSQFKDLFRGFVGVGFSLEDLTASYLGITWRHPLILFILMGFGIARGIGVARELETGTGDLLFSLPLNRTRIIFAEFMATALGLFIINLVLVVGVYLWSLIFAIDDIPGLVGFFWVFVISLFLHIMFAALALAVACRAKSTGQAFAWTIGIISVLYISDFLAAMQPRIEAIHPFTLFYQYNVVDALAGKPLPGETVLFLILTLIFFGLASFFIQRRDL